MTTTYCTVTDVASRLGSDIAADQVLLAIEAASRAVDSFCGRRFYLDASVSARLYKPDPWSARLWVDDIATVTGLLIDTDDNSDGVYETSWPLANVQLEPLNQIVGVVEGHPYTSITTLLRPWPFGGYRHDRIRVTAKWGWLAVPSAVTQAAIDVALRTLENPVGVRNEMIGGYSVGYEQSTGVALIEAEQAMLGPFRKLAPAFA